MSWRRPRTIGRDVEQADVSPTPSLGILRVSMSFTVKPKRVVVAFPKIESGGEWAKIVGLRCRHDPLASVIAPHVTLVFPFDDPVPDEELHAHVERALAGIPGFAEIRLDPL